MDVPAMGEMQEEKEKGVQEDGDERNSGADQGKVMCRWKSVQGLLAVPNLTDSETVCWLVPTFCARSLFTVYCRLIYTTFLLSDDYMRP